MLELFLVGLVVFGVGRMASAENNSVIIWSGVAFLLCVAALALVPLPFLRVLMAAAAAVVVYIAYKVAAQKM